jgi:NMD protein affecting ribosome stability and mRNA decay
VADAAAPNFRCCWGGKDVGDNLLAIMDGSQVTVVSVSKSTVEQHELSSGAPTAVAWVQDRSAKHAVLAVATGNAVALYDPQTFRVVSKAEKCIEVEEGDEIGTLCATSLSFWLVFYVLPPSL